MRPIFGVFLALAVVLAAGNWYRIAQSQCPIPVSYSIGEIDGRFLLGEEAVRAAVTDAESLWEDATGKNLFSYDPEASLAINFVFDDRQEVTLKEADARMELAEKEGDNARIKETYDRLLREYGQAKEDYEARVLRYESRLKRYNEDVLMWNKKGGAPEEVFNTLKKEQTTLAHERDELKSDAHTLNTLVEGINTVSRTGTRAVDEYNKEVAWYNSMFGSNDEFAQGDYTGESINIYQFKDPVELRRVLAHELGHALGLKHTEGSTSIMHHIFEGDHALGLSLEDMAEFREVCGNRL